MLRSNDSGLKGAPWRLDEIAKDKAHAVHEAHAVHAYGPPTPLDAGSVHFSAVKNAVIHIVLKSTPKKSS